MKTYLHPRPLPVLRRARGFFASTIPDCSAGYLVCPRLTPHRGVSPHHPTVRAANSTPLNLFLTPLHLLSPIQST